MALLVAPVTAACPGAGKDATGTDTENTPTGTGTDTEGLTSTSAVTEGATSTAAACELPANEAPGPSIATITIRNDSAAPAYVLPKSQFSCNYTQIEIDIDGVNVLWDHTGVYPYPCDATRCEWGCSDGGANGLIINPGGIAEVPWNGAVWAAETLSELCLAELDCPAGGAECEARRALADVTYTARVQITDTCPGVTEQCDTCAADVCPLFVYDPGAFPTVQSYEASATFPAGAAIVIE